jgi:hypothetical protein
VSVWRIAAATLLLVMACLRRRSLTLISTKHLSHILKVYRLNDVGQYEMLLIGSGSLDLILYSHCYCIEAEFGAEDLNISYGRYEGENKRMAICRVSPNASPPGHVIRWPHNFDNLNLHTLPQFFSTATTP